MRVRAMVLTELVGPDGLELKQVPDPSVIEGSVVAQVGAAGVNYPDLLAMRGDYQLRTPPPFVPGNEIAAPSLTRHRAPASSLETE